MPHLKFYFFTFAAWLTLLFAATGGFVNSNWLAGWRQWDAHWYVKIWREGYFSDPRMSVFPPGYSWLVGPLSELIGSFGLAALLINVTSLFVAAVLATEFCAKRFDISARAFFIFFLSIPITFYTFSIYSDAFFLLVFWGALLFALRDPVTMSRREKIVASIYLFLVPVVRLTGYALLIWVLFRRWFASTVLITFSILLYVNWDLFGDPLHFLHMQQKFTMPPGNLFDGFREAWVTLFRSNPFEMASREAHIWLQVAFLPLASMVLLLLLAAYFAVTGEWLVAVTIATVLIFSRNQAFWRSAFRYDWPLLTLLAVPLLAKTGSEKKLQLFGQTLWPIRFLKRFSFVGLILIFAWLQIHLGIRMHQGAWSF